MEMKTATRNNEGSGKALRVEQESKNDVIKRLKRKRSELTRALEIAITMIPRENFPPGVSAGRNAFAWLVYKGREQNMKNRVG